MGIEQSSTPKTEQENPSQEPLQTEKNPEIYQIYDDIETIDPFILQKISKELYPSDLKLDSSNINELHKIAVDYFTKVSSKITDNEKQIVLTIQRQLTDYIKLSQKLEKRQEELNIRLSKILNLFRALDTEVQNTTTSLKSAIEEADALAAKIDPSFMSFKDFHEQ